MNAKQLIEFEKEIADLFEAGKIPYPIHLSGSKNGAQEKILIKIFKNIKPEDYCFSTHRSHFHYLLKGGSLRKLKKMILDGKSICINDKNLNFFSSAIVAGTPAIAAGVALALKKKGSKRKVFCLMGDGCEDEGHFYEAVRYVDGHKLPCTFIIEDNNRSVETKKEVRYGSSEIKWPKCVVRYHYKPKYPHVGTGNFVDFSGIKTGDKWM